MKTIFRVTLAFLSLLMTSCGVYYAQIPDQPMLEQKGDMRIDAAFSSYIMGAYSSLAYAVTDHVGVQGNLNLGKSGQAMQASMGWFSNHGKQNWDIFAGMGMGETDHPVFWYQHTLGNFNTYFIQGDYGFKGLLDDHLDIAFGVKVGRLTGLSFSSDIDDDIDLPVYERTNLVEPVLTIRFGGEHFKFSIRSGLCSSWPSKVLIGDFYTLTTVAGFNYYFNTRKKH